MEYKKIGLTDFLNRMINAFGIVVLVTMIMGPIIGNDASEISTLFSLGDVGISFRTLYQGMLLSFVCTALSEVLTSDLIFKNMMILWKTVITFFVVGITAGLMSGLFGWFPMDNPKIWIMYVICFILCSGISLALVYKSKREDELINSKLEELKKKNYD